MAVPTAFTRQPVSTAAEPTAPTVTPLSTKNSLTDTSPKPASADTTKLHVDEGQSAYRGCAAALLEDAEPQVLATTYSFDSPAQGGMYSVAIRFTGTRVGVTGKPGKRDCFDRIERVNGLATGIGRVAITTRIRGDDAGDWRVTAMPVEKRGAAVALLQRLPRRVLSTHTRFGLLAQGPGVRLAAWPALVGLGAVVAIVLQALLATRAGIDVSGVLAVSLIGCLLGFVAGKVWCLVLHRKRPREFFTAGACIQGFLVVALGVVALGAVLMEIPAGQLLDATTPGVFLGMAVGRPGCFLTGCCAGRPSGSRWGLWSSDRHLAVRRFPVQLVEAAMALAIGVVTLGLVLTMRSPVPGVIFVGALAAYTFGRQLLFPLRAESRTQRGRAATMVTCGVVLVVAVWTFAFA